MAAEHPHWERRIRAPRLITVGLMSPATTWAADINGRGVVLAVSGRAVEVHAFDVDADPVVLRQVTDREHGTIDAAISPDGQHIFWFDDNAGDETGRWVRESFERGDQVQMLGDLQPGWHSGIVPTRGGGAVVGTFADGFVLSVAAGDGSGTIAGSWSDFAWLTALSSDENQALLQVEPSDDALHTIARVVDVSSGETVAEFVDPGRRVEPVAFRPGDDRCVLAVVEHADFPAPALWDLETGTSRVLRTDLPGTVRGQWSHDGSWVLLISEVEGRTTLHRHEPESGATIAIATHPWTVRDVSARPDGSVHAVVSSAGMPPRLVRFASAGQEPRVLLSPSTDSMPASSPAQRVRADGPGGQVHGLLREPAAGTRPYPALFAIHGGPTLNDHDEWDDLLPAYCDAGYAVVTVDYRGSTGHGAAWREALHARAGAIECEDVAAVYDQLVDDGIIDPGRVAISGLSWGGFVVLHALGRQPERWRSGIAHVPLADWELAWQLEGADVQALDASMLGATFEEDPEVYRRASPISYVDQVTAPLFITAGEEDPRCPIAQIETYVDRLRARRHDVRLHRLPSGHVPFVIDDRVAQVRESLAFLAETVPST